MRMLRNPDGTVGAPKDTSEFSKLSGTLLDAAIKFPDIESITITVNENE